MTRKKNIYVAGHRGMVGSAICRQLAKDDDVQLVVATRAELDLTDQLSVRRFFAGRDIDLVFAAAAKVGGIHANNEYPAEFIYQNLMIQANLIQEAHQAGVGQLLFLGSSCIYPRLADQPMREECLLTGTLEPTNEPYAVAKISGIKLCESYNRQYGRDYRSLMPTNLYGPGDNYHPQNSHVVPALIRRFHDAKLNRAPVVEVWGSGRALREFLYVDDLANAAVHVANLGKAAYLSVVSERVSHINVGTGVDCSIAQLADAIAGVVGFEGRIEFDSSRADGAPRKLLDISRIRATGWAPRIDLAVGLRTTYEDFLAQTALREA